MALWNMTLVCDMHTIIVTHGEEIVQIRETFPGL